MNKNDLSIVIPVHNLDKYVRECVESIFPTKYCLDIILVDDGSNDNSPAICDELAKKHKEISVIHKKNGGAADTRNAGIRAAKSDYVTFIDGDDKIVPGSIDRVIEKIEKNYEVFTFNFFEYYGEDDIRPMTHLNPSLLYNEDGRISDRIFMEVSPLPMPWLYVIKRDFLLDNNIFMHVGLLDEDEEWTARLFAKVNSVKFYDERYYYYRRSREGSLTYGRKFKNTLADIKIIEILQNEKETGNYSGTGKKILDNKRRQMVCKVLDDFPFLTKTERKEAEKMIAPYRSLLKTGTKMDRLHYKFDWLFGRANVDKIAVKISKLKHRG